MSKTSKYDITILKNKAEYNGQKMNIMNFKHKDKTKVKRKDMVNFCNEILKSYRKKYTDGIIEVSIKYPNRWYSADATYLKDDINYFSLDDYDEFGNDPVILLVVNYTVILEEWIQDGLRIFIKLKVICLNHMSPFYI